MNKWGCTVCGFVYNPMNGYPETGISAGTSWEDVPDDWKCPICAVEKDKFNKKKTAQFVQPKTTGKK